MSKTESIINRIKEQDIGISRRRALVVEGDDDVHAIESYLNRHNSSWVNGWVVVPAGSKGNVLKMLEQEDGWLGVVDPDEWTAEIISQQQKIHANLWILPRYCIENYLIVPDELWSALPPKQQAKVVGGAALLQQRIITDLERWVCHGVLWSVVNPLWEGLRSLGFKEALLDPEIAQDNQKIKATLADWHHYLEPDDLFQTYQNRLKEVQSLPEAEKLKRWVHGKKFYAQVVNGLLNNLLGVKPAINRQKSIFRSSPVPHDFESLWVKMDLG